MQYMPLRLKPGKDIPFLHHHHWIFSGAVDNLSSDVKDGQITKILSSDGSFLAQAYINRQSSIIGRIISFDQQPIPKVLYHKILNAWHLRQKMFTDDTTCYRIINSEGDGIPGLIIDRYASVLVIQSTTLGIDLLLPTITDLLLKIAKELYENEWSIYLKSTSPSRRTEGLSTQTKWLSGPIQSQIIVLEDGLKFEVLPENSQKTGLFLDQREMRRLTSTMVKDKKVLNCFSYTGGFTLRALKGGACHVTSVDISKDAIKQLEINLRLNSILPEFHKSYISDVFEFLKSHKKLDYHFVILDPPAYAKTKQDVSTAMIAYRNLNSETLSKMPKGSWLLTSSCSYHIDPSLFQKLIFQASDQADRSVRIIQRHRQAFDHPININHPEGEYLKSLLLFVE
jgi:23S rRNA (cytosine1962-C5)-methyltransferase